MKILKDILYKVHIEAVKGATDVAINKIDAVKQLLVRYPRLHLKLIAHSDGLGLQKFD